LYYYSSSSAKYTGCACARDQGRFRTGPLPVKRPYNGGYCATSVAHAQNILPDMAASGHVTCGHVISGSTSQHLRKW